LPLKLFGTNLGPPFVKAMLDAIEQVGQYHATNGKD
jgi:hypothetical protein